MRAGSRWGKSLSPLGGLIAVVVVFSGCSASNDTAYPSNDVVSSSSVEPNENVEMEGSGELKEVGYKQVSLSNTGNAGVTFFLPAEWKDSIVPGADVGFLVTTAPNNQSLGITVLSESELSNEIATGELLDGVVEDLKLFNKDEPGLTVEIAENQSAPNINKEESGSNFSVLGKIYVRTESSTTVVWITETLGGTFLFTLGNAYSDGKNGVIGDLGSGTSTQNGVPSSETIPEGGVGEIIMGTLISGTAEEQVDFLLSTTNPPKS